MNYEITANHKVYYVHPHAVLRMQQRGISESMVIETLEAGNSWQQDNGRDVYEKTFYDEDDIGVNAFFVRVVVEEDMLVIVSVYVKEEK
ncbi:MAG: DUF4258 domain-containing protein [Chloroflexota bacterium]|nr:DUF4258 domain-containing protein [Chloroflexota bacterium]